MSSETDLDWLARNVDVNPWHSRWIGRCFASGSASFCDVMREDQLPRTASWFRRDDVISRRAELQNKPSWSGSPEWARWLAQDSDGGWWFYRNEPTLDSPVWRGVDRYFSKSGDTIGDWRDTIEKRPEEFKPSIEEANRLAQEFKPSASIEDNQEREMNQDGGWFERGELPPVGVECEILGAFDHYQKWTKCKIIAEHNGSIFAANERSWVNVKHGERKFRPIRTERDVAIDEMKQYCPHHEIWNEVGRMYAEALYDARYRKEPN